MMSRRSLVDGLGLHDGVQRLLRQEGWVREDAGAGAQLTQRIHDVCTMTLRQEG